MLVVVAVRALFVSVFPEYVEVQSRADVTRAATGIEITLSMEWKLKNRVQRKRRG